jgi:hypothetical protein
MGQRAARKLMGGLLARLAKMTPIKEPGAWLAVLLGVCAYSSGRTPMSDLYTLLVIFIGLAAALVVSLGTMALAFVLH